MNQAPPDDARRRAAVFADVYSRNGWGRAPDGRPYYSDSPAHLTAPLRRLVEAFVRRHAVSSVVDLGCGDFELASGIDFGTADYVGIDIYPELIRFNAERHGSPRHSFQALDIVEDPLPPGDLCMVHTVLYLLSERDVFRVLPKLDQYRYVLVTDGQPDVPPDQRKNIDKPTDKYTRQDYYGTGFYLELPPYNRALEVLLEHPLPSGEVMRTVLLTHGGAR